MFDLGPMRGETTNQDCEERSRTCLVPSPRRNLLVIAIQQEINGYYLDVRNVYCNVTPLSCNRLDRWRGLGLSRHAQGSLKAVRSSINTVIEWGQRTPLDARAEAVCELFGNSIHKGHLHRKH